MTKGIASAGWSSTTQPRRSLPTPPILGRRDTSPAGSAEAVTALLVVAALVGWALMVLIARKLQRARRELTDVRRFVEAGERTSLTEAIADDRRDAEDRVAHAEAVLHWVLAAL